MGFQRPIAGEFFPPVSEQLKACSVYWRIANRSLAQAW